MKWEHSILENFEFGNMDENLEDIFNSESEADNVVGNTVDDVLEENRKFTKASPLRYSNEAVVFFNAESVDSVVAASLVNQELAGAEFIPVYEQFAGTLSLDPSKFENKNVIMIDFSFDKDKAEELFRNSPVKIEMTKLPQGDVKIITKVGEEIQEQKAKSLIGAAAKVYPFAETKVSPIKDIRDILFPSRADRGIYNAIIRDRIFDELENLNKSILLGPITGIESLTSASQAKQLLDLPKRIAEIVETTENITQNVVFLNPSLLESAKNAKQLKAEFESHVAKFKELFGIQTEIHTVKDFQDMVTTMYGHRKDIIKDVMKKSEEYVDVLTPQGMVEKVRVFHANSTDARKYKDDITWRLRQEAKDTGLFFEVHELKPGQHKVIAHSTGAIDAAALASQYGGGGTKTRAGFDVDNLDEILRPHGKVWYQRVAKGESFFAAKTQAEMILGENSPLGVTLRTFIKSTANKYIEGTEMSAGDKMLANERVKSNINNAAKKVVKFAAEHPIGWYAAAATTTALLIGTLRGAEFALTSRSLDKHRESKSYPTDQEYEGNPALDNWRKSIKHQVW